jgi:hypothetical protein
MYYWTDSKIVSCLLLPTGPLPAVLRAPASADLLAAAHGGETTTGIRGDSADRAFVPGPGRRPAPHGHRARHPELGQKGLVETLGLEQLA